MPNLVPGAIWQPLPIGKRAKRIKGRGLVGHVAVSSSKNLVPGSVNDWHGYLPKVGPMIQYIDLDLVCYATGEGNPTLAAFESEGGMGNDAQVNAEPWNDNQLDWAARFLRHLHDTEGTPLRAMESSLPSERGFGTHRLGIDPWRCAGGESWSSSRGKLCPGDAKHAQRYEVVRRAAALSSKSKTAPVSEEDDEMKPKLFRLKGTPTVYLAYPGRFVGIDPNFLGTLTAMGEDYKFVDLPTEAHLDFARNYYERFLAPDVVELGDIQGDLDRILSGIAARPTS